MFHFLSGLPGEAEALLADINAKIAPMKAVVKQYEDPVELARLKYPYLDWDHTNEINAEAFCKIYDSCVSAIDKGQNSCRNKDTVFGDLIRARTHFNCYKPSGSDKFEFWIETRRCWQPNFKPDDLCEYVRQELRDAFGTVVYNPLTEDYERGSPEEPLEQDAFCKKVAETAVKYQQRSKMPTLDDPSVTRDRILFDDGRLFDFRDGSTRFVMPSDRLFRHCDGPLPSWDAPAEVKEKARMWVDDVCAFFIAKGVDLNEVSYESVADALAESQELRDLRLRANGLLQELLKCPACRVLKGVYNTFEDTNELVFLLRIIARVLCGKSGFAEAYAFTGPPSGGKSFLVMLMVKLLGQGPEFLCHVLPPGYFTNQPRQDPDGSRLMLCMPTRLDSVLIFLFF